MPKKAARKTPVKAPRKAVGAVRPAAKNTAKADAPSSNELVILTGMSGAGKASALKAFEDMGYYSVDNLPLELIPRFADLVRSSAEIDRAALVIDVREGNRLERFPGIVKKVRKVLSTRVLFLDASDDSLVRRFSETRRPHPMGREETVVQSIAAERKRLDPVRNVADIILETTKFNVHELRAHINAQFQERESSGRDLTISSMSFGFKNGVPSDADLVFDVRFPTQSALCSGVSRPDRQAIPRWRNMCRAFGRRMSFWIRRRTCWSFCCRTTSRKARAI